MAATIVRPWLAAEREEGAAARMLGVRREQNPYRGSAALGYAQELADAWDAGWVLGRELPRQRRAAREQREGIAAIRRALGPQSARRPSAGPMGDRRERRLGTRRARERAAREGW